MTKEIPLMATVIQIALAYSLGFIWGKSWDTNFGKEPALILILRYFVMLGIVVGLTCVQMCK